MKADTEKYWTYLTYLSCNTVDIAVRSWSDKNYSGLSLSRLLSISNFSLFRTKSSISWTFVYSLSYFLSLYLELLYRDQKSWSLATISLSILNFFPSKAPFTQQIEQKCSIFENWNVIKTFEIWKLDCNQNVTKCKGFVLN